MTEQQLEAKQMKSIATLLCDLFLGSDEEPFWHEASTSLVEDALIHAVRDCSEDQLEDVMPKMLEFIEGVANYTTPEGDEYYYYQMLPGKQLASIVENVIVGLSSEDAEDYLISSLQCAL